MPDDNAQAAPQATAGQVTDPAPASPPPAAAPAAGEPAAATDAPAADGQAAAEAFALKAPEGAEAFQADFDRFSGEMNTWLAANPNATAREALAEAANRQAAFAGESLAAQEKRMDEWRAASEKELRADKEFGGENYDKNFAIAVKGLEAIGSPELRELLETTGIGNSPVLVRAFHKVGQLVADAPIATAAQPAQSAKSAAARMYPNMKL